MSASSSLPTSVEAPATFDQSTDRGLHVAERLRTNVIAWLTTVRAGAQPDSVPVWYLWQEDGTLLIYSRPNTPKVRNLQVHPQVSFTLDDTHGGSDVVRIEGTAVVHADDAGQQVAAAYAEKYDESIVYIGYEDAEAFGAVYSTAIVITPTRYHV